jgi:hypothetical protein
MGAVAGACTGQKDVVAGQQNTQDAELALDEIQLDEKQISDEHYDAEADEEDVAVEATVLMLKHIPPPTLVTNDSKANTHL